MLLTNKFYENHLGSGSFILNLWYYADFFQIISFKERSNWQLYQTSG